MGGTLPARGRTGFVGDALPDARPARRGRRDLRRSRAAAVDWCSTWGRAAGWPGRTCRNAPEILGEYGHIPLPPYIRKGRARGDQNAIRRSTPSRRFRRGATAELHFTPAVFDALKNAASTGRSSRCTSAWARSSRSRSRTSRTPHACRVGSTARGGAAVTRIASGGAVASLRSVRRRCACWRRLRRRARSGRGRARRTCSSGRRTFRVVDALLTNFHLPRTHPAVGGSVRRPDLVSKAYRAR
jgi:S-adenosylmethionine:tRNA ribosyltransferase-isomerase